jgi:hypothetical protein
MASGQIRLTFPLGILLIVTFRQGFAKPLGSAPAGVNLVAATVDGQAGTFLLDTGTERSCLDADDTFDTLALQSMRN